GQARPQQSHRREHGAQIVWTLLLSVGLARAREVALAHQPALRATDYALLFAEVLVEAGQGVERHRVDGRGGLTRRPASQNWATAGAFRYGRRGACRPDRTPPLRA